MPHAYALITNQGNLTTILPLPGTLGTTASASQQDVIQAATGQRVLLHVHGGLVPQQAALAGAHRLSNTGGPPDGVHYKPDRAAVQLYLVWPADLLAAINRTLNDTVLGKVVTTITDWFSTHRGGPGWRSVEEPIDAVTLERDYARELRKTVTPEEEDTTALLVTEDPATGERSFTGLTLAKVAVDATLAIIGRRNTNPDPYEFEAMVREEVLNASGLGPVGQKLWTEMKANAEQHATGDFRSFLQAVYDACSDLTLVGHSTGANLITALISTLNVPDPAAKKLRVVFLAPAVTLNAFNAQRAAFERHLETPLRIYTMAHTVEIKDRTVPLYPGSLLQLVNFVFENPRPGHVLGLAHYALTEQATFGSLVEIHTDHACTTHGGFDDDQCILNLV